MARFFLWLWLALDRAATITGESLAQPARRRGRREASRLSMPQRNQIGEEACENPGFGPAECTAVGCCEYDDGQCWYSSFLGVTACSSSSVPQPATSVVLQDTDYRPGHVKGYILITGDISTTGYVVVWQNNENNLPPFLCSIVAEWKVFIPTTSQINLTIAQQEVPTGATRLVVIASRSSTFIPAQPAETSSMSVALECTTNDDWRMCTKVTNNWFFCNTKKNCDWTAGKRNRCQKTDVTNVPGNEACTICGKNCNSLVPTPGICDEDDDDRRLMEWSSPVGTRGAIFI